MKKIALTSLAAAAVFASTPATASNELSVNASASVANFYLWRGLNLGAFEAGRAGASNNSAFGGIPQVAADLTVSASGLYAGTWAGSGDANNGTEIDFYVGYGTSYNDFNLDVSYATFLYPTQKVRIGEVAEAGVTLGYGPVSYMIGYNAAKELGKDEKRDWSYMKLSAEYGQFAATLGKHNKGLTHADVTYNHNKNLAFTVSMPVDNEVKNYNKEPLLHVQYNLPLKF